MKKMLCLIMFLTACAPLQTNYKAGVSVAQLNRDQTSCDVRALQQVPASIQIRRLPPEFVPAIKRCRSDGKCRVIPGYWIPGETQSYDPNAGLRARVAQQCMSAKGYSPVSIPPCSAEIARAAPPLATTRLPRLTEKTCVIRNRDGSVQIVAAG